MLIEKLEHNDELNNRLDEECDREKLWGEICRAVYNKGPLTVRELIDYLQRDPYNVIVMVQNMLERGTVYRRSDLEKPNIRLILDFILELGSRFNCYGDFVSGVKCFVEVKKSFFGWKNRK